MTESDSRAPSALAGVGQPAARSVELAITGMTCASCANRIERKLNKREGVSATVNFATEKAAVEVSGDVDPEELVTIVEQAGYGARLPAPEPDPTDARRTRGRSTSPTRRPATCATGCWSRPPSACPSSRWRWCRRGSSPTGSGSR